MVAIFGTLLLKHVLSISYNDSVLLYSDETPNSLLSELSEFQRRLNIASNNQEAIIKELEQIDFMLIIDATLQTTYYNLLDSIALYFQVSYFSLSSISDQNFYSKSRYNLHGSTSDQAEAILSVIKFLELNKIVLLSSSNSANIEMGNYIYNHYSKYISYYIKYEENLPQITADSISARIIKANGLRQIVILDYGTSLDNIESSIINKNLDSEGSIILMCSKSIYSASIEGSLIIAESGTENSTSYEFYQHSVIDKTFSDINKFISASNILNIDKHNLNRIIQEIYSNHTTTTYELINIRKGNKVIVGVINNDLNLTRKIYFPGNSTDAKPSESIKLTFSIANGTSEPYNLSQYYLFAYYYYGAIYAVNEINANQAIPGFEIDLFSTNCGNFVYDPAWYIQCFSGILNYMGIAYLSPYWYSASYGNLLTLKQLGVYLPQVSPFSQGSFVDNLTEFPEFLKLSVSSTEFFSTGCLYSIALGWNNIVILATNDSNYYQQYLDVMSYLNASGIKVLNPPSKRILPSNYTRDNFKEYESYFQAAKNTNCRIFIIVATDKGLIAEGLYDVGMRKGDLILITESSIITSLSGIEQQYLIKREELFYGTLVLSYREWIGTFGTSLQQEFMKTYSDVSYMCMAYDSVSVIKDSLTYMILKGDDYEDSKLLSKTMRNNIITGCLGTIYFSENSNSRGSSKFIFQQLLLNTNNNTWFFNDVSYLDKYAPEVITSISNFIWSSGETTTPNNFRSYNPCPFDSYQIIESKIGKIILGIISFIFFIISIISAKLSCGKYKNFRMLTQKKLLSFSDMVFLSYFFFQFVQLVVIGPKQDSLYYVANNLYILLSVNFLDFLRLSFYNYWAFYCCLLIVTLLLELLILVFTIKHSILQEKITIITELVFPVIGNIGFLPILSMLMTIYNCNHGISENLSDSYLDQDCTIFCYTGKHLIYSILATPCICIYIYAFIYYRRLWEKTQSCLHLETKTVYLSVLSVLQVLFAILEKTLKVYSEIVFGWVLCSIILGLIIFTIYFKPYNCTMINLVQCFSLILSFWGILTALIFKYINILIIWVYVEIIGFFIIFIFAIIFVSKVPLMLYVDQSISISKLLYNFFHNSKYTPELDEQQVSKTNIDSKIYDNRGSIYNLPDD